MPDGFPAYLDIAASRDQAANFINFLQEGLFFDQYTREVITQVVTYNANLKQLANIRVNFVYNDAGQGLTLVHFSAQRKHILWDTLGA